MSPFQMRLAAAMLLALAWKSSAVAAGKKSKPAISIEGLAPPRPAKPPRVNDSDAGESEAPSREEQDAETERQLERKRRRRQEQQEKAEQGRPSEAQRRQAQLLEEALQPRERKLAIELALIGCSAVASGERTGYSCDPNVHFNVFYRLHSDRNRDDLSTWIGWRQAAFNGTGFHSGRPGRYGLTYFGPMIGLGRVAPVPEDTGDGDRPAAGSDDDRQLPVVTGFAATFGFAAVAPMGRREEETEGKEPNDDFHSGGVRFDAPGAWAELRYFRIHYGAVSSDFLAGVQTGASKAFVYFGVGLGGWH